MARYPVPGEAFGAYDVGPELGRGAMGVVFRATHRGLQREVALKVVSQDLAGTEDYRRRFEREAQVLARLESPYVIGVYDAGEVEGILYIATQLIPGGDLAALLNQRGPMPAEAALAVLAQVAEGLEAAHRVGVLHRDIKPSNVLVREEPAGLHAFLCDLGIAQTPDSGLTRTSTVIGTLGYLAPERHDGAPASVASDVYALGCLLWAMVTGSAPYVGTDARVAMAHLYSPVPQLPATTPAQRKVNEVVAVAMAKDPAQRHPSAQALLDHVRGASVPAIPSPVGAPAGPPPYVAPAPSASRRRRIGLVVGLVLALVAAAVAVGVVATRGGEDDGVVVTGGVERTTTEPASPTESTVNCADTGSGGAPSNPCGDHSGADPFRMGPALPVDGAQEGGTVRVQVPEAGPQDLDPSNLYDFTGESIAEQLLLRSLTQWLRDPVTGEMELRPDLATDLGTPNEDYTEWRFTLRDGVKWSDGSDVTIDDLVFGLSRAFDVNEFVNFPGFYAAQYFEGGSTYLGPYTGKGDAPALSVEGNTLQIDLAEPFPDLPYYMALPVMGPVKRGAASRPPAYGKKPLATGPYKVDTFEPGERLVLVRNDSWDPNTDVARHAYPDRYEFEFDADPTRALSEVTTPGSTSLLTDVDDSAFDQAQSALGDGAVVQPAPCVYYLAPDWDATGGDTEQGRLLRQAIGYGYPYDDALAAGGYTVSRTPAGSLLVPGTPGRADDGPAYTYDPTQAKALLEQAGYGAGNPFRITMSYWSTDPTAVATQQAVTRGLRRAGFEVRAIATDASPTEVYGTTTGKLGRINDSLTLRTSGWCTDWPTGANVLPSILGPGAAYNYARLDDPALGRQMDEALLYPIDEQPAAWVEIDRTIVEDLVALIPRAYSATAMAFGDGLGGYGGEVVLGGPYYKDLFVVR